MKPCILFKFRPANTCKQVARIIDSINNRQIFVPDYKELNDPLESSGYVIEISGYAGISIHREADEEDPVVSNCREQYKILSLTKDCFSPSMWLHYTNNYNGVCLGYWNKGIFSDARQVEYIDEPKYATSLNRYGFVDDDNLENKVMESFFYKHSDWSYEKEWRIVKKQDADFINYKPDELACVIFGKNLCNSIQKRVIKKANINVPIYYATVGYRSFGVNLLEQGYDVELDGSSSPYIRNVDDLVTDIRSKSVR